MELNNIELQNREQWELAGFELPQYNLEEMKKETKENPFWIHFGAGNIFRAFQANVVHNLLNMRTLKAGLIVAEGFDYEIIEKVYRPYQNLSILVTMHENGLLEKRVVGSIAEALVMDRNAEKDMERLKEIFRKESLQMASFTITEKGYSLTAKEGCYLEDVVKDLEVGPLFSQSYMGKIAALLYERFLAGKLPIAMVSMDNCSQNGLKLFDAMHIFAKEWEKKGLVHDGFVDYVEDDQRVSFPFTMIDKITPRPDKTVEEMLQKNGLEEMGIVVTQKGTFTAPFVNTEQSEYLVIEDQFPNKRPVLEKGGFLFTDRATVEKTERMKVCTCLNPLHTTLAIYGSLLDYQLISDAIKDPELYYLVGEIGYREGLPVVEDPGILNPKEFLETVLTKRIPNPYMPDTPQRIATDTSQKLSIRFGETIKAYLKKKRDCQKELSGIALVYAGWLRYLMGFNDKLENMELSMDPLLEGLREQMKQVKLGDIKEIENILKPLLSNSVLFGVDLYEANLAPLVLCYFYKMIKGKGAVKNTLREYREN